MESYALARSIKHADNGICFFRANSCSRRITKIISVVERFGRKPLCSYGRIPTRSQYSIEAASDDLQQYLAGVRYQRDAPVVAELCPILLFMEYHDDGIFPLLRHLPPPPSTGDDIEQSLPQGGITVECDIEQLNGDSVRSDSLSVRQRADGACELLHRGLNS